MWLFTTSGFFSIVKHKTQPDTFMVRSRSIRDLENIRVLAGLTQKVILTPDADYPARLIINTEQKTALINKLGETIEYTNFKSAVHLERSQEDKDAAYMDVWSIMRRTEAPRPPVKGTQKKTRIVRGKRQGGLLPAGSLFPSPHSAGELLPGTEEEIDYADPWNDTEDEAALAL